MIERLLIKDSLLFDEVLICPHRGFNVFSGVSGSGKSVLMTNILALFGLQDSSANLIECTLKCDTSSVNLEDFGILDSGEIVISVMKKDKTKYFINNQASSKKRVKEMFGDYVKHIHTNSNALLTPSALLRILDSIIAHKNPSYCDLLARFRENYHALNDKKCALEKLENDEKNIMELKEFTRFEISHIQNIAPKINEYEGLLEFKKTLSKKEKIMDKIASLTPVIENFSALLGLLDMLERNKAIFEETLNDIANIVNDEQERLSHINENDIESVLERLEKLGNLVHKYGSISGALEALEKKKRDLEYYENISFNKSALQKEVEELKHAVSKLSTEIFAHRSTHIHIFTQELERHCDTLMLRKPNVALTQVTLHINGTEQVEISLQDSHISTLSSGESNRLKLALLCVDIQYNKACGILILDEIDANLSGKESEGVAKILQYLSRDYQIFGISHQSHMPILAHNHYLVKINDQKSEVLELDKNGRIEEIARMISGENITQKARSFAEDRLKNL